MKRRLATPWDALLGLQRCRLPQSASVTVVVEGCVVRDARDLQQHQVAALQRTKAAARYQAERQNPERMAKRQAWIDANPDKVAEYRRRNRERNHERNRQLQSEWARRAYHQDPEKYRARTREWYQRNREKVLARLQAQRDQKRLARIAATTQEPA